MAKGASVKELVHYLRVSRETIYQWANPESKQYHRKFADALELGKELSEAWWLRFGRLATQGAVRAGPPGWYVWQTKNRFGYKDRVEHSGTEDAPLHVHLKDYRFDDEELDADGDSTGA